MAMPTLPLVFALVLDIGTAVFRPSRFVVAGSFGPLHAPADSINLRIGYAQQQQSIAHSGSPPLAQSQVVLAAAVFIRIAFDPDLLVPMTGQIGRMRLH